MKVAMVTPYWHPVRGGVTTYVSGLTEALRRQGVEVHVLAREGGGAGATTIGGAPRAFARQAAAALDSLRPDAVHAHGHWYALAAALRHRRRNPRARVLFTMHTEFPDTGRLRRSAIRRLLSRADVLTAVSEELLERTVRAFRPRTRTRVTRPGTATRRASAEAVDAFHRDADIPAGARIVAFVGPLEYAAKARGVAQLVRAMRLVREAHPEALLVVAGDGARRPDLEALARAEVRDGARFLGNVADSAPLLTAASAYAHVSFQEGLPLALLEAMACGAPILATPVGGMPEIVRDGVNGLLVEGDPDSIARGLRSLLGPSGLAERLASRAASDVEHGFRWPAAAAPFLPLYGVPTRKRVVVTVDLERDYHTPEARFRGIEVALPTLLDLFERHGVQAHVFATSDLCDRFPDALREVVRRGHALGCHGESHDVAYLSAKPFAWQLASIRRATDAIERCTGVRPSSFRAPNFSANGDTIRALEELGYRVDSSVLPGRVVRRWRVLRVLDFLVAPRDPYRPSADDPAVPGRAGLVEFPVTENPLAPGGPIGLGYLHTHGVDRTLDVVRASAASPCVFLIHPWELVEPPGGPIPAWMRAGCSADPSRLDAFLARLREEDALTTFERELAASPIAPTPG